jgi:uncharacterized integral membrane protein (TIGR00698 family)
MALKERDSGRRLPTRATHAQNFKISLPANKKAQFSMGVALTLVIGLVAFLLAPLPGLAAVGALTIAMTLGIAARAAFGLPSQLAGGVQFSAKKLLRVAIVLIGVRLNFGLIFASGVQILLLDLLLILGGLAFIPWLGRKFGLPAPLAFLIAVGQSICGASAVSAAGSMRPDAKDDDMTLAIGLCGVVGTIGVIGFVLAFNTLGLSPNFYALLTGSTLHEIGQVAAAAPAAGTSAADYALIVKLTRVVLLAPVLIGLAFLMAAQMQKTDDGAKSRFSLKNVPIPYFVFGFLAVGALNSVGLFPKEVAGLILNAATLLFVMAMAGMGLMVDLRCIRKYGLPALGASLVAFGLFTAASVALVFLFGMI